ncbi:hypothetical protein VJ920_07885 [Adlercreutzia sp. R22]|uniref:Lipoprotein n=2 Tax=Adlercreutzia shanghongiae TaxID=3111773 RepID=A0ABU6IZT9_9ACTN|nr:hypothetical protein [Adlercreutzia sp. R22]
MGLLGKRVAFGALAAVLALGLCACKGGSDQNGAPAEAPAASSEDKAAQFADFQELMSSQADNYTYDYRETYTLDNGSWTEESVSSLTVACDDAGDVSYQHVTYLPEDSVLAGLEQYFVGEKVIEVNGEIVTDVSIEYADDLVEMDMAEFCPAGKVEYSAETLSDVAQSDDGVTYSFAFAGPEQVPDDMGMVSDVESAQVSVRFNGEGVLVQQTFDASGTANGIDEAFSVTTSGTIDFSKWGETDVPEAPEPSSVMTSTDLAATQKAAAESVAALPDNLTCVTESEVVVNGESQALVHAEVLRNGRDAVLYVETDGNEDEALLTFFQGDENMVFQGDQFVSKGEGGLPEDSTGTEQALALIDYADTGYTYDGYGLTEYAFIVDGSALPADMSFDGVESVDSITLEYWVNPDGSLYEVYMAVNGVTPDAQGGEPVVMSVTASYSDLGTTEVPSMPEA